MLFHIIADYGSGDLAFAEVIQRIKIRLPDAEPVLTPVPPFSTLAAGFCIAQLGLNPAPSGTIIYHNIAPRQDSDEAREKNAGEQLAFARLPNGVRVIGVNAGYTFSFIRDIAEELRWARVPEAGSQFRSRDLFPDAASDIAVGNPDALAEPISPDEIPVAPPDCIAYVDGYGNLKTTIPDGVVDSEPGSKIFIRVGDVEHQATISGGSFEVPSGALAFAPGSSGWEVRPKGRIQWMEIFLRGGNAWEMYGRPAVGSHIRVRHIIEKAA
ncbi:MAG: SAM-dependent chlorinase/fluorinase [Acidobacteriaceae bacterium]|nr:SAM-dependent chlorinase/fluorinase [Acidobacteriaceae bacterium]